MTAPDRVDGRNVVVVYRISNGIDTSQSTVTLSTADPYDNPPVVPDAFGATGNGDTVTTDVLSTAYDPDGPPSKLSIARVFPPSGVRASVDGASIKVSRRKDPIVVPFVVRDGDGGETTASLYVPPATGGRPFVRPDALIRLKPGGTFQGRLSDFVTNPGGGALRFTSGTRVWGSPDGGVSVQPTGKDTFTVRGAPRYTGPGAMVFEVTTATGVNAQNKAGAVKAVLTIPVQVGEDKPVLQCPDASLSVPQSQSIAVNILAICHVWTIDPAQMPSLEYDARWKQDASGVSLGKVDGSVVAVRASADARPGSVATLAVSASGSDQGLIRIRVTRSPPPRLTPVRVRDLKYGETRTLDLTPYLIPGVRDPQPTVLSARQVSGPPVRITAQGSSVTLRALKHVHGHAEFRIEMSDAGKSAGPERRVAGRISLDLLDVPGRPAAPLPGSQQHDSRVPMQLFAPVDNGSRIDRYEVRNDKGRTITCGSRDCEMTGLKNGTTYRFQARAHNAVGWGEWSAKSRPASPDEQAGQVRAGRLL
jgi:hypothetical protein